MYKCRMWAEQKVKWEILSEARYGSVQLTVYCLQFIGDST